MFKRFLSLTLVILLVNVVGVRFAYADSKDEKQARHTEKVKKSIIELGVGEEARVKVKLRDNTKLKGYISQVGEHYFVVTDPKTGTATKVVYGDVKEARGDNLSTGAKIGVGVGIGVAILLTLALIGARHAQ
jgi:hypothetical protein